ncbi:MAG TPA: CAP domain-containing protein [Baekduia sp.]|nr:CAP domain-containing protein [Baekduia sp.]
MLTTLLRARAAVAAALALAGGATALAPVDDADAAVKRLRKVCIKSHYDMPVTQLKDNGAWAVICLTNEKRRAHGLLPLKESRGLAATARSHADKAVALKWWSFENGAVSHDDPQIDDPNDNRTPEDDSDVRIKRGGFCPSGAWAVAENTFASAGTSTRTEPATGAHPPTPRGAVEWWYHSPYGHRDAMLNPKFKELGVGVARGFAFPQDVGSAPAGTFVQQYGSCG